MILSKKRITKVLISLHRCAGWSAPVLFTNPKTDRFFRVEAHVVLASSHSRSLQGFNKVLAEDILLMFTFSKQVFNESFYFCNGSKLHERHKFD